MRKDVAAIIMFVGIAVFFWSHKMVDLQTKEAQLVKAKNKLAALKSAAEQVALLEEKIKALEDKLPELKKALPSEADLESLVKQFSTFAKQTRLRITSINSFKAKRVGPKDPFKSWEINFTGGTSTYENILSFLDKVNAMQRAFEPVSLSVSYNKDWRKKGSRLVLYGRFRTYIRR